MKQSYDEIMVYTKSTSLLYYIDSKIAAFLVYKFQNLPLTANMITSFSFFLVLLAIPFLFINLKLIFVLFLILSYTLDNVDGIWARLKNQTSKFGHFFDGFLDKAKDYLIDLSFIIFYFNDINNYIADSKLILIIISLYFICKGLFYMMRDRNIAISIPNNLKKRKIKLLQYGGAEKFIIIYTLLSFNFGFFAVYIIGFLFLYFTSIIRGLHKMFYSLKKD